MPRLNIPEALAQGFIVDDCCNPPVAYKGPRFQPTEYQLCYTPLETALIAEVVAALDMMDWVDTFRARERLKGLLQ